MIADTTFILDLLEERARRETGPVTGLFNRFRAHNFLITVITAGEVAAGFASTLAAQEFIREWRVIPMHNGIMFRAAEIDRALIKTGKRLGENDNWIAGFAAYYRQPLLSRDKGFDNANEFIRRVPYKV